MLSQNPWCGTVVRFLAICFLVMTSLTTALADDVPRRVIAFHHPGDEILKLHALHTMAEMPLNYLGLEIDYREIDAPLPEAAIRDPNVAGVVTWFEQGRMPDPAAYLDWAERMVAAGKKFVILGDIGFLAANDGTPTDRRQVDRFLRSLGFELHGDWSDVTFDTRIVERDPEMYGFERLPGGKLPPYEIYRPAGPATRTHLKVQRTSDGAESHLVMTSPNAGFVADGWSSYKDPGFARTQWYVNPFNLFRTVFGTDDQPKPDVTTLSGRRIYFSHIDGDGWRNVSLVKGYAERQAYSARVVMERAIADYPDLPVTVGPIVADLDPAWSGDAKAQQIARELFALPQVEPAQHTYSHPFAWEFFEDYTPTKEAPFTRLYNIRDRAAWGEELLESDAARSSYSLAEAYDQPRGFGSLPFDLELEFGPAADFVERFTPADKPVELVLWPGNTSPTPRMIRASRAAGLLNLNGGDSRFDPEFPSVSYVPPVGRRFGGETQIFAAASNENTYTDLWSGRYFGFRDLVHTLRNTETPRRLKPINVYYHMYSGERTASLNALLENLDYVRSQTIAPVAASHYVRMAEGFYTTRFEVLGERHWRVLDRGALQTVRYDNAGSLVVDMASAVGVLGYTHCQESLYVALDAAVAAPEFRLVPRDAATPPAVATLDNARWHIWNLARDGGALSFEAKGFGPGEMRWLGLAPGRWQVAAELADGTEVATAADVGQDGVLAAVLAAEAYAPLRVTMRRLGDS